MDTNLTLAGTRLGTIRRHGYTIAVDYEARPEGTRRFALAATSPDQADEPLGTVTVAGDDLQVEWNTAAGDIGLVDGSAFQTGVHRVLRSLAAALDGAPLATGHGVRLHPDWEYRITVIETQGAV